MRSATDSNGDVGVDAASSPTRRRQAGVTLLELMIVIVIVAILSAIAFNSYQKQIRKSRRANAESDLVELTQFMERNFTNCNRYDMMSGSVLGTCNTATALPFSQSPKDSSTKHYDLTVTAGVLTYTLTATPRSATGQNEDPCGTLSIAHTGAKSVSTGQAGCWP